MTTLMTDMSRPLQLSDLRHWDVFWASLAGVGFLRPSPCTWGSAAALLLWWFSLAHLLWWQQALVCGVYFLLSWWTCERICQRYGLKDASELVADEVAGLWLALIFVPKIWWLALLAFALFRLLDIAKPGPIGWLDRNTQGGLGVMLDDMLAGLGTGLLVLAVYVVTL